MKFISARDMTCHQQHTSCGHRTLRVVRIFALDTEVVAPRDWCLSQRGKGSERPQARTCARPAPSTPSNTLLSNTVKHPFVKRHAVGRHHAYQSQSATLPTGFVCQGHVGEEARRASRPCHQASVRRAVSVSTPFLHLLALVARNHRGDLDESVRV